MIKKIKQENYKKLFIGFLFDAIGMISFSLPIIGEFSDVIWAPLSAFMMTRIYKGNTGKIAGLINLFEELLPGLDFVPTFTLTWIYQNIILKNKKKNNID